MTSLRRLSVFSVALILMITGASFSTGSGNNLIKFRSQNLDLSISGTSTLHDWEMKSNKGKCEVVLALDNNDKITQLTGLYFEVLTESLKSEHTSMDDNTYKALNSKNNKTINYVLSSATVTQSDAVTYQIRTIGKLTIAGATKETDVNAVAKYNAADKSFTITGSKKIRMTDFGVKPPTMMLGTIKTGNDITVSFATKIIR
jgi:hypothetical protein